MTSIRTAYGRFLSREGKDGLRRATREDFPKGASAAILQPTGLVDKPRGGPKGSRLPELTKRTILMLKKKKSNPSWGVQRISDMLLRGPALPASPEAVARVLHEAGYELEEAPPPNRRRPLKHPAAMRPVRHIHRWQVGLTPLPLPG